MSSPPETHPIEEEKPCCRLKKLVGEMSARDNTGGEGVFKEDARPLSDFLQEMAPDGCRSCWRQIPDYLDEAIKYIVQHTALSRDDPRNSYQRSLDAHDEENRELCPVGGPRYQDYTGYPLGEVVEFFRHLPVPRCWLRYAIRIAAMARSDVALMELFAQKAEKVGIVMTVAVSSLGYVALPEWLSPEGPPRGGALEDDSEDDSEDDFRPTPDMVKAYAQKLERILELLLGLPGVSDATIAVLELEDPKAMARELGFHPESFYNGKAELRKARALAERLRKRILAGASGAPPPA